MEEIKRKRPQDDVPIEKIIHYIVKDYRNMFNKYQAIEPERQKMRETIQRCRDKVKELVHELRQKQIEAMSESGEKEMLKKLLDLAQRNKEKITKQEELIETLYKQIEDTKNSRNAVVEAVVDDLKEKLETANKKIVLLSQAVVEPDKADSVFLQSCKVHCIESDDDRTWMAGAMKQLEKAGMQLIATEQRLADLDDMLEGVSSDEENKKLRKKINTILSKINSTISHIECFFDKVGEIKIEEDESNTSN